MVTKAEQAIYDAVLERDRLMTLEQIIPPGMATEWLARSPWVCVARLLGVSDRCSGEMERDHVHEHAGGTKGKRAPTTMDTLVILCHHHHQDGWATAHRPEIREYIKTANERYQNLLGQGDSLVPGPSQEP
jgi:hypothetical protein